MERTRRDIFKGWKVVIIDDDHATRDIVGLVIERYGATAYTAQNGREGLALIREHKPHFVISDLDMPVLNGWQMIEMVQEDETIRAIPVIALTAHYLFNEHTQLMTLGFFAYVVKPIKPSVFVTELANMLQAIPHLAKALASSTS